MSLVRVEHAGAVATLTLNRPEARNALSVEMCNDIVAALEGFGSDFDSRVLIVRGGGKVFCSGADFAAVSGPGGLEFLPAFERMLGTLAGFKLPTIAAIQGAALGGGFQLATVCDFRVADREAKLGIPSSKLGILVNFENVQRLVFLAGVARAKELLITGRTMSGTEAAAGGLINAAVDDTELGSYVGHLATEIASRAPLSVQGTKRSIQAVMDHLGGARSSNPGVVAAIDELVGEAYRSEDLVEGVAAMSEKRAPEFKGR